MISTFEYFCRDMTRCVSANRCVDGCMHGEITRDNEYAKWRAAAWADGRRKMEVKCEVAERLAMMEVMDAT
jgi:hypothetical protein